MTIESKLLAATRSIRAGAAKVSALIITLAAVVAATGTRIHRAALIRATQISERRVVKAAEHVVTLQSQRALLADMIVVAKNAARDTAKGHEAFKTGVEAELVSL